MNAPLRARSQEPGEPDFGQKNISLSASRQRIQNLETALDEHSIVAITDSKGRITYVNNKFCAISKYSPKELLGQDHRIINSGYHDKSFFRDLWQTIRAGRVWKGELRNRAKDGTHYWVATTIVPFTDATGVITEFVSIRTDITERKNSELALRESEAKLQALFYTMSEGLSLNEVVRDSAGEMIDYRVIAVNNAFYASADYRGSEVIGSLASELYGMSREEISEFWKTHRHRTESVTTEYISPISKRAYQVSTSPIVENRFVTSFIDITETKAHDEQVRNLARAVMTVSEKERAEISGEMHDSIGQGIVLLKLNLQKKLDAVLPGESDLVREMLHPIDDILKMVRRMSHRLSPVYLKNLGIVAAIDHMAERIMENTGIKIQTDITTLEGVFSENWNLDLYRIIQEALTNVIKHAAATAIYVTAITMPDSILVEVRDNGKGMENEKGPANGIGLLLMQQRALSFRGAVHFENMKPGFALQVQFPAGPKGAQL